MQLFQPLEPEDFALIKNISVETKQESVDFCNTFTGEVRGSCQRESWPLFREQLTESSEGLAKFCERGETTEEKRRCYNAVFYIITAQFDFDESKIVPICNGLSRVRKAQCYGNSASRYLETDYRLTDRAVSMCKLAEKEGVGDRCYEELLFYSAFNFYEGSKAFTTLCNALPGTWRDRCLAGEGATMRMPKDI